MEARIERGRIRIHLGKDVDEVQASRLQEQILFLIGSAKVVEPGPDTEVEYIGAAPLEMSCALSVANFRKLKTLGCKMAPDGHTRTIVEKMRLDLEAYNAGSQRAALAKQGKLELPPYDFEKARAIGKPPYAHQVLGWQFLHAFDEPALFGGCGTGKTMIVSTVIDSLVRWGEPWVALVICPVNLIKHVWLEDVAQFTDLAAVSLREEKSADLRVEDFDEKGDPTDRTERAALRAARSKDPAYRKKVARPRANRRYGKILAERFAQPAHVYVLNYENLRSDPKEKRVLELCKRLVKEGKKIYLVIDESSKLKSRTSRTYRSLKRISMHCNRCVIMTGTPSPNGLEDLWAQFSVLDGGKTLQPNFVDYRHDTHKEIQLRGVTWVGHDGKTHTATKWHPKPGAAMQVFKTIEPRMIRFRTDDCIDLPPKRFLIRDVAMNEEQRGVYDDMENMLFAEVEGGTVTAAIAGVRMLKLREITGGFVITDAGVEKQLGKDSPKMVELDELLEQSIADKLGDEGPPSKAIVWAQYQWEMKTLVKRYQRYGALGMFGGTSLGEKDRAIERLRDDPRCRMVVCHPASVGHGLTLVSANYVFYYSLSHNFEEFYQSFRRSSRIGQKRVVTHYFLVCPGTIDEELIDAIRAKKNLSDLVTDGRYSREEILGRRGQNRGGQLQVSWDGPDLPDAPDR